MSWDVELYGNELPEAMVVHNMMSWEIDLYSRELLEAIVGHNMMICDVELCNRELTYTYRSRSQYDELQCRTVQQRITGSRLQYVSWDVEMYI
jgi:hypothetical protein